MNTKTCISALRGEIGASLQETRDMKTKIFFVKHMMKDNTLLREILHSQLREKNGSKWITRVKKILSDLKLTINQVESYNTLKLKKILKEHDDKLWQEDIEDKSTLKIYKKYKKEIKDEQVLYDNTKESTILFRTRVGTLSLNDINRHQNKDTNCLLCKEDCENLEHFLLHCTELNTTRRGIKTLQQPYKEDIDDIIAEFLLFKERNDKEITQNKEDLYKLWAQRNAIIESQKRK